MYSHILVPTDGTHLASQTISQAVQFARSVGARITFFYADPDAGASLTDDGALIHLLDPGLYQDDFGGAPARSSRRPRCRRARATSTASA